ncbi:hypothetical protein INR35_26240, partial [Escherichia coli]|nr:hypothetical protein [Escherichia coli]
NDKNLTIYYVLPDEQYRPDLLAYRMWGIAELRWVVTLAAGLEVLKLRISSGVK